MNKVLFIVIPERGHVHPYLGPARELAARGVEVHFHAAADIRPILAGAGLDRFIPGPPRPQRDHGVNSGRDFAAKVEDRAWLRQWIKTLLVDAAADDVAPTRAILRELRPDVVVIDPMVYAAAIAADLEQVPWVAMSNSLNPVLPDHMTSDLLDTVGWLAPDRDALFRRFGLSARFRGCDLLSPWLNLAFTTPALSGREVDGVQQVGPSLSPRGDPPAPFWPRLDDSRPLVYMSFGSQIYHQPAAFRAAMAAVSGRPVNLLMVVGGLDPNELGPLPDNVIAVPYAPQLEVLARTRVFLTHGGANSVMEALAFGVPTIVSPICNDQFHNAWFVERAGCGLRLDLREAPPETIWNGVARLLDDGPERAAAARIRESYRSHDGAAESARLVIGLARSSGGAGRGCVLTRMPNPVTTSVSSRVGEEANAIREITSTALAVSNPHGARGEDLTPRSMPSAIAMAPPTPLGMYLPHTASPLADAADSTQVTIPLAITARNEERAIGACLDSLLLAVDYAEARSSVRYDVMVVLDECDDRTGEIAARLARVRTVASRGGLVEAQRQVATSEAPFVIFADADIAVSESAIHDLTVALLERPGLRVAYGRKSPLPPERATILARALWSFNHNDGFQTPRHWLNGRLFAIRGWSIPTREELLPRLSALPRDPFYDFHAGMRIDDIYLSRSILHDHGPGAIAEIATARVDYRPPATFAGMYKTYRRMRMENERLDILFPELARVHRRFGVRRIDATRFRSAPVGDRLLFLVFHFAMLPVRARYRVERAWYQRFARKVCEPWALIPETKVPIRTASR